MSRCLASCNVTDFDIKRCIREAGHKEDHIWVEATDAYNMAYVIRWLGNEKFPSERLLARKVKE